MMTPKEKAKVLFEAFENVYTGVYKKSVSEIKEICYVAISFLQQQVMNDYKSFKTVKGVIGVDGWKDNELLYLNDCKKEVDAICEHRWIRTTKNYKRIKKCFECGAIK